MRILFSVFPIKAAHAFSGTVLFSLLLPTLLLTLHTRGFRTELGSPQFCAEQFVGSLSWNWLLMMFVLEALSYEAWLPRLDEGHAMCCGARYGALFSLFNVPMAFLLSQLLSPASWAFARAAACVLLSGACSGAFLGWVKFRETRPDTRRFPRFGLSTLLAVSLCWGLLAVLFAPA